MNNAPGYAIAYLRDVDVNNEIVSYIERIDATLAPYGGHFIVHGGHITPAEGVWDGDIIVIRFPGIDAAREWYASPGYQEILPLRTRNSDGNAIIIDGNADDHRGADILSG